MRNAYVGREINVMGSIELTGFAAIVCKRLICTEQTGTAKPVPTLKHIDIKLLIILIVVYTLSELL